VANPYLKSNKIAPAAPLYVVSGLKILLFAFLTPMGNPCYNYLRLFIAALIHPNGGLLGTVMTSISKLRKLRETRTAALVALIKAQEDGQKDSTYWPPTVKEGVGCTQTVLTMNVPFQDAAEYHWLDDVEMTPEEEAEEYRLRPSKMSSLQLWHLMHPQRFIIGDTILVRKTGTKANVFDLTFEAKDVPLSDEELFTLVDTLKALADRTNGVINILQHGKEGR
jgi:hypothetical protein